MLSYNGKQGNKLLSKMKKHLNKLLSIKVKTTVTYKGKKLGTKYQLKNKTKFNHQNNLVYYSKCLDKTFNKDYVAEKDRRLRKELWTTTSVTKIPICYNIFARGTINMCGKMTSEFWAIITAQSLKGKLVKLFL